MSKVKICCISSETEAEIAIEYGADALGLVSEMPSGPGVISESLIRRIASKVEPKIETFLLTSKTTVEEIAEQYENCFTTTIQICDDLVNGDHVLLRKRLPNVKLVQVVHVRDDSAIEKAKTLDGKVDAILLDSGNQNLAVKELGGTGKTHNWSVSRKIVESVNTPVYLAGGLNPKNIAEAIEQVNPFGVDVCSGVRTNGKLDRKKTADFIRLAKSRNKF